MRIACFSAKDYDQKYFGEDHLLVEANHEITYFTSRLSEQTAVLARGFDAVCIFVDDDAGRSVLEVLHKAGIKLILLRCTGSSKLDQVAAAELSIVVRSVPTYSPFAVAEHTVAMILCLNRKLHRSYSRVRDGNFSLDGLLGFDMHDKTIGVIGTGQVGALVAKSLKLGFGCQVVAFDSNPSERLKSIGVTYCASLNELFATANVISLHVPFTAATRRLINADSLVRMKQGTMLINTSHGGLVDTRAVIEALKTQKLGALGIDVYEEEGNIFYEDFRDRPIPDDHLARLLTFPNVLITAHQAFFTVASLKRIAHATLQNATQFARCEAQP